MSKMDQANQYLFEELVERIQVQSEAAGIAVAIADAAMKLYHGRNPLESRELYQEHIWDERDQRAACGFYRSGEGAELEIRTDKDNTGRILLLINGQEVRFVMVQRDLGIVRRPNKDVSVKLFRNETGEVFAAGYGGRMLPRVSG